jgi:beta-carotene ketolase (CrtW type)
LIESPGGPRAARRPAAGLRGLAWAVAIITAWLASLLLLLLLPAAGPGLPPALLMAAVLARAFLQTGLFIVAHDAMHGSLLPASAAWNDRIGRLALGLYAWLPWDSCRRNHRRHHRAPASRHDPDHHDGRHRGALAWYLNFMASYLRPVQMTALLGTWLVSLLLLAPHTSQPLERLLLFWTLPLLISSLQLFVIGTYLPHRGAAIGGGAGSGDRHRAVSLAWPGVLSFLACFHFGYHWEHHENPQLPWYRLPEGRRLLTVRPGPGSCLALAEISR